jgi:hypothetical protein
LVSNTWHHTPVIFYFDKNNAVDKYAIAIMLYDYDQEKFYVAGYIAKVDQARFLTKVEMDERHSDVDLSKVGYPRNMPSAFTELYNMSTPQVTYITKQTASNYVFFGNIIRHKSGYGKDSVSVSVIPPRDVRPILVGDDVHSNFYRGNGNTCDVVIPEHESEQKFKLIYDNPINYDGRILYQIEATKLFTNKATGITINKGWKGGCVEKESNLSQSGTCWIMRGAKVYGDAKVTCDAVVTGTANVLDDAVIGDFANVGGTATIEDTAKVHGKSEVIGNSHISGDCTISFGTHINVYYDDDTQFEQDDEW